MQLCLEHHYHKLRQQCAYNPELNANLRARFQKAATRKENLRLYPRVAAGDPDAREEMITHNMPFVIYLVEAHLRKWPKRAHLQDELTANGFMRLVDAVNRLANQKRVGKCNPTGFISPLRNRSLYDTALDCALVRTPHYAPSVTVTTDLDVSKVMLSNGVDTPEDIDTREAIEVCCETEEESLCVAAREQGYSFRDIQESFGFSRMAASRALGNVLRRYDAKKQRELQR